VESELVTAISAVLVIAHLELLTLRLSDVLKIDIGNRILACELRLFPDADSQAEQTALTEIAVTVLGQASPVPSNFRVIYFVTIRISPRKHCDRDV